MATGDVIVIRYADDGIVGFQHEHEARAFLQELQERMRKFELVLHPDKTRLIRFGRYAAKQRERRAEGKPETFEFLGFTHFCTQSRKWGSFVIGRKTIKKRMRARTAQAIARPYRENRSMGETGAARAPELLRRLGERPEPVVVLQPGALVLAARASAPQSARLHHLGEVHPPRRPLLSADPDITPSTLSPL